MMQWFLKLHGSSNVILIENLNQNDRNKMNNIYQPEKRKPRFPDLVSQKIQTLHYSRRTEKTYIGWIKRFILFHGKRHPVKMGEKEINRFLSYLAIKKQVTASTQNQALCAIVFLYRQVLNKDIGLLEGLK